MKKKSRGFTLIEILIVVAIIAALAAIGMTLMKSVKGKAQQTNTLKKMKSLGVAFVAFTTDNNGVLPNEDSPGTDDWRTAGDPDNQLVWYNALTKLMQAPTVGELGATKPARFYDDSYPLTIPGAPYPSAEARLAKPSFAVAMNSRLQRNPATGTAPSTRFSQILAPAKTVLFLERGMPGDKKSMPTQSGFDGSPKANARAFAARHNQKGCLIFADGHAEVLAASQLLTSTGGIITPQLNIVWTLNPEADPE
jgi:prepilin-type N-terminal cleavage/methylation domain-containing protein